MPNQYGGSVRYSIPLCGELIKTKAQESSNLCKTYLCKALPALYIVQLWAAWFIWFSTAQDSKTSRLMIGRDSLPVDMFQKTFLHEVHPDSQEVKVSTFSVADPGITIRSRQISLKIWYTSDYPARLLALPPCWPSG